MTRVTQDLKAVTWRYLNSVRLALSKISLPAIAPATRHCLAVHFSYALRTLIAFLPAARLMAPRGFPRCIFPAGFYAVRGSRLGYRWDPEAAATRIRTYGEISTESQPGDR